MRFIEWCDSHAQLDEIVLNIDLKIVNLEKIWNFFRQIKEPEVFRLHLIDPWNNDVKSIVKEILSMVINWLLGVPLSKLELTWNNIDVIDFDLTPLDHGLVVLLPHLEVHLKVLVIKWDNSFIVIDIEDVSDHAEFDWNVFVLKDESRGTLESEGDAQGRVVTHLAGNLWDRTL